MCGIYNFLEGEKMRFKMSQIEIRTITDILDSLIKVLFPPVMEPRMVPIDDRRNVRFSPDQQ